MHRYRQDCPKAIMNKNFMERQKNLLRSNGKKHRQRHSLLPSAERDKQLRQPNYDHSLQNMSVQFPSLTRTTVPISLTSDKPLLFKSVRSLFAT